MRDQLHQILAVLLLAGFLAGCATGGTGIQTELAGTTWVVERIVHTSGRVDRGSGESITFGADGNLTLKSCNTCNAAYRISRGTLSIAQPMACTRRACGPGQPELETLLTTDRTLHMEGEYLVIESMDEESGPQLLLLPE